MTSGAAEMEKLNAPETAVLVSASVTWKTRPLGDPAAVGVPLITPAADNERPVGSVPDLRLQT
jgi:hypothetical protein